VKIIKLDDLIKGPVNIIKADIEGYESKALLGAKNLILNNLPLLIIAVEHYSGQKQELVKIIKQINEKYKFINLTPETLCFYISEKHQNRINNLNNNF